VQQNPGISDHHAGTKHVRETGDERDRIAIFVDDREIGGISAEAASRRSSQRLVQVDKFTPRGYELFGK
jgi:hypothetical protein